MGDQVIGMSTCVSSEQVIKSFEGVGVSSERVTKLSKELVFPANGWLTLSCFNEGKFFQTAYKWM